MEKPVHELPDRRAMEGVMRGLLGGLVGPREETPLSKTQDLMYEAFESHDPMERVELAKKALELCPDCADAYVLLAEHTKNRKEALGLYLARCSASDPEPPLLPLARRPPCGTTNPSKEESFLEGFVVPGWGRLGAAGPVSMAARRAERPREPRPCSRPLSGPRAARPGESGSREG
jgi:hypothetical protein